jgi:hypothetical protein
MKQMNKYCMVAMFAAFFLFLTTGIQSQVVIGDVTTGHPVPGSLLDLSPGSNLGLLLQQIELEDVDKIPTAFTERKGAGPASDLQGLLVYNTNTGFQDGAGLYVWDGAQWQALKPVKSFSLTESSLTLNNIGSANTGTSTATDLMDRDNNPMPTATVTWSKVNAGDPITIAPSGNLVTITANPGAAAGTYTVRATAGSITHDCDVEVRALTSITLDPASLTFYAANQELSIQVSVFKDDEDDVMTGMGGVPVTWSIVNGTTSGSFLNGNSVTLGTGYVIVLPDTKSGDFRVRATVSGEGYEFSDEVPVRYHPCELSQIAGNLWCYSLSASRMYAPYPPDCPANMSAANYNYMIADGVTAPVWFATYGTIVMWEYTGQTSPDRLYSDGTAWIRLQGNGATTCRAICRSSQLQ